MNKQPDIDSYIAAFPEDIQELLEKVRRTIREAAPDAKEVISYGMPAFQKDQVLVYFAAFSRHIGFFPTSSGIRQFAQELSCYNHSKGGVQFPYGNEIPFELIQRIVKFRLLEVETAHSKRKR